MSVCSSVVFFLSFGQQIWFAHDFYFCLFLSQMLPYLSACLSSFFWRDPFLEVEKLTNLCGRGGWESFLTMGEKLRIQIPKGRAYINFCSRPTTCWKKSNLLKCWHVNIFISVLFSHHTKNTTDEQTDRHAADLVFWDTAFTAIGKSTPVHVLLASCGLFQSRDECDL